MSHQASTIHGDVEELRRELAEAREQQATTAEILRVISGSPMDLQRVFAEIAASAARLCDAYDAMIRQVDGEVLRLVAHHGPIPAGETMPLTRGIPAAHAILARRTIHITDLLTETDEFPEGSDRARSLGFRTILAVPLVHASEAIGVISIRRPEVRPFTDRQIELLKTFADQAVIAIENTRLFEEVQARNTELRVALEQQMATADILRVLGSSPSNAQPVFDCIAENAKRLLNGHSARIQILSNDALLTAAYTTTSESADDVLKALPPASLTNVPVLAKAVRDLAPYFVPDIEADEVPPEAKHLARIRGWRSVLAVPMVQHGRAIGIINVTRLDPGVFAEKEITLLKTFADQAVIAIENTRLFEAEQESKRELQESLEYQTAISGVLNVISRSPSDIQPVLDTIVRTAERLCEPDYALIFKQADDGSYHLAANSNASPAFVEWLRDNPIRAGDGSVVGIVLVEKRTVHLPDALADARFTDFSRLRQANARTLLAVPLLREGNPIGVINLLRRKVQPFSQKQIDLVTTFADQAVIAIENARLFEEVQARTHELQALLEYQTATSNVLNVISRSPTDVQPVFNTIAESAAQLCGAPLCNVFQFDGLAIHIAASQSSDGHGVTREALAANANQPAIQPGRGSAAARAIATNAISEIPDIDADPEYELVNIARVAKLGSTMAVPMHKDGRPIGAIALGRFQKGHFPARQIELLRTFADQAVIAIENTRLFEEVQARNTELRVALEQQTATANYLRSLAALPSTYSPCLRPWLRTR